MNGENAMPAPNPQAQGGLAGRPPCRVYLKDLELPPEVVREVDTFCRERNYGRASRQHVEEGLKLQFFFGGKDVGYIPTSQGLLIVAVGEMNTEAFSAQLARLTAEERLRVSLYSPEPWGETATRI
jgi:hypothetical protein